MIERNRRHELGIRNIEIQLELFQGGNISLVEAVYDGGPGNPDIVNPDIAHGIRGIKIFLAVHSIHDRFKLLGQERAPVHINDIRGNAVYAGVTDQTVCFGAVLIGNINRDMLEDFL